MSMLKYFALSIKKLPRRLKGRKTIVYVHIFAPCTFPHLPDVPRLLTAFRFRELPRPAG